MKIITPGHLYELANFESILPEFNQRLQFIHKERAETVSGFKPGDDPNKLITVQDGTTNEEVFRVLIDRLNSLQAKFPCRENAIAITHIETALLWLEKRTADRKARGVEGQAKA